MFKNVLVQFLIITCAITVFGNEACFNYWSNPHGVSFRFNYAYFVKQKADFIREIESGKIESEFKTAEEKIAFIEALAAVHVKNHSEGWTLPVGQKLQEKMLKYVETLDVKNITMYQVNKFIAFAYRERLALFFPVKKWGLKPLKEVTDDQVVARIEEETMNNGILEALLNLGFIGDPVGIKRFMTFVNKNEHRIELGVSAAFNSVFIAFQGLTWMTPLSLKLPMINLFSVEKPFSTSPYTSLSQNEVPDELKTTLKDMYMTGTLKPRRADGTIQIPLSTYGTHYYSIVNKIQLPLFFAALWSSIGLNMYNNYGGPNHNGLVDVVKIEIVKTKDQALSVLKIIMPSKPGDQNETH